MPRYRLTYFCENGRGETARQLLEIAGVDWEDVRLKWGGEEWAKLKPKMPFGQLPMLEELDSGFRLSQSNAINRYLANKFGMTGKTMEDAAQVDMILEALYDYILPMEQIMFEKEENRKMSLMSTYRDVTINLYMDRFESLLKENKTGSGFFVGETITVADISFAEAADWPTVYLKCKVPWDKYPTLKALQDRVNSYPAIAAWIKKRPPSEIPETYL